MNNMNNKINKRINETLVMIKMICLLFSAIVCYNYLFEKSIKETTIQSYNVVIVFLSVAILLIAYILWSFNNITKEKDKSKITSVIEYTSLMTIMFITILLLGKEQGNYKFLFLFIIILANIEGGLKFSLYTAISSSAMVLIMDFLFNGFQSFNVLLSNNLIIIISFVFVALVLGLYFKVQDEHKKELEHIANTDMLTGLYNYRYFNYILQELYCNAKKENSFLALMMIDIDNLREYNELYGRQQGDLALKKLSSIIKEWSETEDTLARYEGDEFAIILKGATEEYALQRGENLRKKIEEESFSKEGGNQANLMVSIGISHYPSKAKTDVEMIRFAQEALFKAKVLKKNKVEIYNSILDDLNNELQEAQNDPDLINSLKTIISIINAKDKCSFSHLKRVVMYSKLVADEMNLNDEEKKQLIYAAYMHDIGKVRISKEILLKDVPLSTDEWEMLMEHPVSGVEIIQPIKTLELIAPLVLHHHERYDGGGYPSGLKGQEIPYLARLLSIIDSFDAMTSYRTYNKRKTFEEAFLELRKCSGTQFDGVLVEKFISIVKKNTNKIEFIRT
ncbi:diguanylate cyclase (GGDEF) domain-containing protein [Clostridium collagenovorans DSM 3089]|uniref:Diguanylate cyclase (GGDEF) domain-containing protein n=1 Tax=Clostridium collagenovorans DSM 3089 TaxID=1121306 RepID=A0A1M5U1B3_9CLOT|nr:diguanylate cyclase [Clostridium collagenovorans]SHH56827.1 diguanylate cyclase (GGDEF) domain-containing protein [Clostridium collagenovorans DSM 3089]